MSPDRHDLSSALRFSPINPLIVQEIIACYRAGDDRDYRVGFVARLFKSNPLGEFVYVVLTIESSMRRESVMTQYFTTEPYHLYIRAEDWQTKEVIDAINKELGYSKANAQYGSTSSAFNPLNARPLVRSDS